MMSYNSNGGVFPFTSNELCTISQHLTSVIQKMEENLKDVDKHEYVNLVVLNAKIYAYVTLTDSEGNDD